MEDAVTCRTTPAVGTLSAELFGPDNDIPVADAEDEGRN